MRRFALVAVVLGLGSVVLSANPPSKVLSPNQVYVPPGVTDAYQATFSNNDSLLQQVVVELRLLRADFKSLRADVQALRGSQVMPPAELTLASVMVNRCAKCHKDGVDPETKAPISAKGGGVILVESDNTVSDFTPGYKRAILAKVDQGLMPPRSEQPLSLPEKAVFDVFRPK